MKLAERLAALSGGPVDWNGQSVHMMHEMPDLRDGSQLRVTFLAVSSDRPQALRLKAIGGELEVAGESLRDVVLWSDSVPDDVFITLRSGGKTAIKLRLWNAWRDPSGVMQSWIGNAGMLVADSGRDGLTLRCSDGFNGVSFDDLVVKVEKL